MSDILDQLWANAQQGFVQSYSQPAQGANIGEIDSRLKIKKMGMPTAGASQSGQQDSGDQSGAVSGSGYQSLTQQAISNGIGG